MHAARLSTSPRLKRTLRVLQRANGEISSLELLLRARIANVSATISELRQNGAAITCRQTTDNRGARVWLYTLHKSPDTK